MVSKIFSHGLNPCLLLTLATVLAGCAAPPQQALQHHAVEGIRALAPPFRDYSLGKHISTGLACSSEHAIPVRYVESLDYVAGPPVTFGIDRDGCIQEILVDYASGEGRYNHAVAFVSDRLGASDGEGKAVCGESSQEISYAYWFVPEGRLEVVRPVGKESAHYVLRPTEAPLTYVRACGGQATR